MSKASKILQIVQMCAEHFEHIPTITFNQASSDYYNVVLVGGDETVTQGSACMPGCHVFYMTEEQLLEKILRRDPILADLFANAIVLKDLLQIMPLALNSVSHDNDFEWRPIYAGDLEVVFYDAPSPEIFVAKTFIPFMEMNKASLSKCRFVISSQTVNHKTGIKVNFFGLKKDFDLLTFKRQLIMNISELPLHMVGVGRPDSESAIADDDLNMLQEVSEQAVLSYSSDNDQDQIVRKILQCYFGILSANAASINECRVMNQYVLEELLPRSLSSVTSEFLLFHDKSDGVEKVKKEYRTQFNENQTCFFDEVASLLKTARMREANAAPFEDDICNKNEVVKGLYHAAFSASMMHPYYLAFIPFCLNEVLKYET